MGAVGTADEELVLLAAAGDVEALAGLLERYRPSLYAAAIGVLRDREHAADAVQDTFLAALAHLSSLRDPRAVGGWLHQILRNTCLGYLRRNGRAEPTEDIAAATSAPSVEDVVERLGIGEWLWNAIDVLAPEDRLAIMLRYFTRCETYEAIATVTGAPVGTVRSRLNRARSQLSDRLLRTAAGSAWSHAAREREQLTEWRGFYAELHEAPVPRTYRSNFAPGVSVTDGTGTWRGLVEWSAHEREAIDLGVRADIVGLVAGADVTVLEIDFTNRECASDHCPPRSTFVHRLSGGRSERLDIYYV
jgi:RNA polymerase sigma-70 factor (ECF subfamily)